MCRVLLCMVLRYTVSQPRRHFDVFEKFFHHQTRQWICNELILKDHYTTTPQMHLSVQTDSNTSTHLTTSVTAVYQQERPVNPSVSRILQNWHRPCVTLTFLHLRCRERLGVYRNMCKPGLVTIHGILIEILTERDVLTPKIHRLMPLPHGPLLLSGIKIGSFIFKILWSQVW